MKVTLSSKDFYYKGQVVDYFIHPGFLLPSGVECLPLFPPPLSALHPGRAFSGL